MRAVRAIGLSGQMHGAVLLDAAGEVLRPAILWNDGRSEPQCAEFTERVPRLAQIAGNLAMPGFTAPKLLWVRDHQPLIFAQVAKVLLPKDWLRFKLSGEFFTDCSDASGTLWLDVGRTRLVGRTAGRVRHDARADACAGRGQRARRPSEERRRGALRPERAASSSPEAAVTTPRARWAWAPRRPGDGFVSLGTSGVIFLCSDRFLPAPAVGRARVLPRVARTPGTR